MIMLWKNISFMSNSAEASSPGKLIPEEFQNMSVKECVHQSLRTLLEEVMQTVDLHYKKNYLARVNQWYTSKLAVIDDKLRNKPMPPVNIQPNLSKKSMKRQITLLKKKEEIENDISPVKKIALGRSPTNKTKFPPIKRMDSDFEAGGESPYRKYYDGQKFASKNSIKKQGDNFTGQVISLHKAENDIEMPYKENMVIANNMGHQLWKSHREKKMILNRSQEQLQRSISKWGNTKSTHHERSLMCADRHAIMYNNSAMTWKAKPKSPKRKDLNQSLFMSKDKFLESDDEELKSSDSDERTNPKTRNQTNNDYSFVDGEEQISSIMSKIHDMSYMTNDHDAVMNSSIGQINSGNDSFFLTKKNIEGDLSPKKVNEAGDNKQNTVLNPIMKLNKIQKLRHMKGGLIGANRGPEPENTDTLFNTEAAIKRHISLSLYSRPKSLAEKRGSDYDDTFASMSLRKNAPLRNGPVTKYQSNHSQHRTKQIDEISTLKNDLTGQDINCSVMTIQRAILFPEDIPEETRKYPNIDSLLLHNPFATKKKKKKKGKKKKK